LLIFATLLAGCTTHVPPAAVQWTNAAETLKPNARTQSVPGEGYLKVDTDTDLREIGRRSYFNVRRTYDIYAADGTLLRADVDNDGGRFGEVAARVTLPSGRYVVASVYGTVYKKLQVLIQPGSLTEVPESAWSQAPAVFPK
jgi:hypothetical protein